MNDPIRLDKTDRDISRGKNTSQITKLSAFFHKKSKLMIVILILLICALLLSFFFFRQTKNETLSGNNEQNQTTNEPNINNNIPQYQQLDPPKISTQATLTNQQTTPNKKRVEISGEITDLLLEKQAQNNKDEAGVSLTSSQSDQAPKNHNELILSQQLEEQHYTIQLSASSSLENLLAVTKKYQLKNYQIYETRRNTQPWFVLIKGNYALSNDAKLAIKSLPIELQKSAPWVKSGKVVLEEKLFNKHSK